MSRRKPSRGKLLGLVTAMVGLVLALAMPRNALVELISDIFELEIMTLSTALIALVALIAAAAVGIGYGIGMERSTKRPGMADVLYRHRRDNYGRRRR